MRAHIPLLLAAVLALSSSHAADLRVSHAWARATAPGQPVGAAFMDLSAATDMVLLGAESPAARVVELHTMSMQEGVMQMRQLDRIELPGKRTVSLRPGGLHIMLIELTGPLRAGSRTTLNLRVQRAGGKEEIVPVEVPVLASAPAPRR